MRPKKRKKVLLVEPNYSNKYPPIGLMKIATYHRNRGDWDVTFFKGDLKEFVIDQITDKCITELERIDDSIDWHLRKDHVRDFIYKRQKESLYQIHPEDSILEILITSKLIEYKDYYHKGTWKKEPEWDRIFVTTLFTFYWDITIETINFAKLLVKKKKDLMVGGVLASIQPDEIKKATGITPRVGILNVPGELDEGDEQIIDNLPLDYSILDEIEYKYPMSNAFYGYMTRGCIRHCPFCAVPTLEPTFCEYIPLKERIDLVRKQYGDQKDLLLMDNNVLASKEFDKIIQDIIDSGFGKDGKYVQPNLLDLSIRNLKAGYNDRAYIRKTQSVIMDFYQKLKGEESYEVYRIMDKYHIYKLITTKKENLIQAYEELSPIYNKHYHPTARLRYVDFNQGVDARLFTPEKVELLSKIAIRPLRIAFDDIKTFKAYNQAIRWSAQAGIKDFSNYLLYNFKDQPIELYQRLKINVELCDELSVNIYSFPMKYHPITKGKDWNEDYSHNRDYIGQYWNRKYIRAIQAILNSTKGKVGRGKSFFYEAFGSTEEEFFELLEMPETFILYRFFFKWLDTKGEKGTDSWRTCWKSCMQEFTDEEKTTVLDLIHANVFTQEIIGNIKNPKQKELLSYYYDYRKDIITPGSHLYELKQLFDQENNG